MSIKQILMKRDNITENEADNLIAEATESMHEYLGEGDMEGAENVCAEFFGFEPDYIMELL